MDRDHRGHRDPDDEGGAADGVGGHTADHQCDHREVEHLSVVGEQRHQVRVPGQALHRSIGLVAVHHEQHPEQHGGGGGEAELAPERQAEPEPRALVGEHLAEVEVVAEAADRVQDPQRPDREHPRQQQLLPRAGGAGAPRPRGQEPPAGEGEVGHERVAQRHHEGDVADEQLVAPQLGVELVAGVGHAQVHRPVLGQRPDPHRDHGVDDGPAPTQLADGAPGEDDPEQGDVPATDDRADDLVHRPSMTLASGSWSIDVASGS